VSAKILQDLDKVDDAMAKVAAMRIRVLEKGIRDALRLLATLSDEKAIDALTQALRSGYGMGGEKE
jgi:hypothetical protein